MKNISFIIPAFNCEKTIEESVDSIIDTNFEFGDEIVITDDCSTDNTFKKINEIKEKNPEKITIIKHEKNMGGGAARNTSVKNSKNEIIFCLDSDNILIPNSIKPLKKLLIDNLEAGAAAFQKIKYFKKDINKITHEWHYIDNKVTLKDALCGHMNPTSSGNYIFTKKSWEKAGGYPEKVGALDAWGFGLKQLLTGSSIMILNNTGYYHRYGHSSYWVRESKSKSFSKKAKLIIEPFLNKIFKDDIEYIENSSNWFEELKNKPIRDNNGLIGQDGVKNILIKINLLDIIKKYVKKIIKISLFPLILFDYLKFKKNNNRFSIKISDVYPCIKDKTLKTKFDTHYVYHTSWAARKVKEINPVVHTDISSSLYFSGIVSAFVPVNFYDYRPAELNLSNLKSEHADLNKLPFQNNSIKSLSCMHTIEHVGLGRYGDPIDPDGDLKAISELKRVISNDGSLLFVVPVGKTKIEFNAHRIYSYEQIEEYFNDLKMKEFTLITDEGKFIENADKNLVKEQKYGCGCFWFIKT